jgi:hypothetical protein
MSGQEKAALVRAMQHELDEYSDELDDITRAEIIARFRNYSERNALLVVMQLPTATDVRGYNEWLKDSRQVKHGEKSIKILAPSGEAQPTIDENGQKTLGRRFFRLVSVFDISQTEAKTE